MNTAFVVEAALKVTALLGVAWAVVALLLRNRSAAVRHQVWSLALAGVLAWPFLSTVTPVMRVPIAGSSLMGGFVFRTEVLGSAREVKAGNTNSHSSQSVPVIQLLWGFGTAASLGQMLIGWIVVERMRRKAKAVRSVDGVEVCETPAGSMPITYGLFRPVILLPADAEGWSEERRRVVLLHELAHIRRHDVATHLLARLALAFYWWHPLVWVGWREAVKEQERATDDAVLNAGEGAAEYASHLLAMARSIRWQTAAALAMARTSQLEGRMEAILDAGRDRKAPRRATSVAVSLVALAILVPIAGMQAKAGDGGARAIASNGGSSDQATLLMNEGKVALGAKEWEKAKALFENAAAEDAQKTGEAKMWLAVTQSDQNKGEEAAALYKEAVAAQDPNSPLAPVIRQLYARQLDDLGRHEEANNIASEAGLMREMQESKARAASSPSGPAVRKIGGDVHAPTMESKVEPQYSEDARLAKYDGVVQLAIEIGTDGVPRNIRIIRPLGLGLDQKAVEAVGQWRFHPGTVEGKPVPVSANVEVQFRLL